MHQDDRPTGTLQRLLDGLAAGDVSELRALAEVIVTQEAERRSAAHFFADFRDVE